MCERVSERVCVRESMCVRESGRESGRERVRERVRERERERARARESVCMCIITSVCVCDSTYLQAGQGAHKCGNRRRCASQ